MEGEDRRFPQSELSDLLRDNIAGTLRPTVLLYGGRALWAPWSQMLHTIRTGETAFSKVHGAELLLPATPGRRWSGTCLRSKEPVGATPLSSGSKVGFRHQLTSRFAWDAGAGTEFAGPHDRPSFFFPTGLSLGF